jgi:hypothetical protein
MKLENLRWAVIALALCSCSVSAQEWWAKYADQAPATMPALPTTPARPTTPGPDQAAMSDARPMAGDAHAARVDARTVTNVDKAECDAEVARTYPANLWAPGLGKKRQELFDACIQTRTAPPEKVAASSSVDKAQCDAEVARTYPVNLWAPGLGKKRQELFDACMTQRGH